MAGHNHLREVPLHREPLAINDRRLHNRLPLSIVGTAGSHQPSTVLEDRIAIQNQEIQSLLLHNQHLAATHVALKQELLIVEEELRSLSAAAINVKAERDGEVREVYQRSLKMEAELRSTDALRTELVQVASDVQKLRIHHEQLAAELRAVNGNLAKERTKVQDLHAIKAEIKTMQQEIHQGRVAIECEKKTCASNLEHGQTIEQNMVAIACEIKKFHAELANAEKRARAAAAAASSAYPSSCCWNLQQS